VRSCSSTQTVPYWTVQQQLQLLSTLLIQRALTLHCCKNCTVPHSPDAEGIVYDPAASGTLLHTAALYSRTDCIPLLLAAGVDATSVSAEHTTALSQACFRCDVATVKLLLEAGGWARECGFSCLCNAVRAGSSEVLELLFAAAAAAAAAAGSSSADSTIAADPYCVQGTVGRGYTLMHAAAAVHSLSCAEVLLRHGADATAVSTDFAGGDPDMWGLSPLDLLVLPCIDWKLLPDDGVVPELEPAEFDKFALMLLSSGAAIKHSAMSADQYMRFAGGLRKHTERLQQQIRKRDRPAAVHATASWCYSNSDNSSTSSSSSSGGNSVRVQLVHAVTKQAGGRVYTLDTKLLEQLYSSAATATTASMDGRSASCKASTATHTAGSSSSNSSGCEHDAAAHSLVHQNVLLKMLVPPPAWQSHTTNELKFISYDGKCVRA
jgi:Ankyrin repeats (3 copies)